tara:strand:- start:12005 stop:12319 length:315 start_codon:yes stop_codon:yes gene_type:complete
MTIYVVYSFFPEIKKAKNIAKEAIRRKLAACVNINKNINSLFMWNNKFCDEKEIELSFKTHKNKIKTLISFLKANHPYECPAILSFQIKETNKEFYNWINKELN